jgi:hypothetical protein
MAIAKHKAAQAEANSDLDLDLRTANETLAKARATAKADQSEVQRLEAADLPLDATDADIERHVHALSVAKVRVSISAKRLAAAEANAVAIAESAAEAKREDNLKTAIKYQIEMVERFRAEYPAAMAGLFRLLFECHLAESTIWAVHKDLPKGAPGPESVFGFSGRDPAHVWIQLVDAMGGVVWQNDEHGDIASASF